MNACCKRLLCATLSALLVLEPATTSYRLAQAAGALLALAQAHAAWAEPPPLSDEDFDAAAAQGQQTGETSRDAVVLPTFDSETGEITWIDEAGESQILDTREIFGDDGSGDPTGTYGDDVALEALISETWSDLASEDTATGDAFRALSESTLSHSHPDLLNDPIALETQEALYDEDYDLNALFGDCTSDTEVTETPITTYREELAYCERLQVPGACEVTRDVQVDHGVAPACDANGSFPVYDAAGAPANTLSLTNLLQFTGSTTLTVSGACTADRTALTLSLRLDRDFVPCGGQGGFGERHTAASGTLTRDFTVPFNAPVDLHSMWIDAWWNEHDVACEPSQAEVTVDLIHTPSTVAAHPQADALIAAGIAPDSPMSILDLTLSWSGYPPLGAGSIAVPRLYLLYEADGVTVSDEAIEFPPGCVAATQSNEACTVSWECTDLDDARVIDGVTITPETYGDVLTPLFPGDDPTEAICYQGVAHSTCGVPVPPPECWIDVRGDEHCEQGDGSILISDETCETLEADPECGFVSSTCIGEDSQTGVCLLFEETWTCRRPVETTDVGVTTTYACDGPVRCMGGECIDYDAYQEDNDDFAKAASYISMRDYLALDADCLAGDCTFFTGEPMHCKTVLGGIVDCCDDPEGVSIGDYLKLIALSRQIDKKYGLLDQIPAVTGAWATVTEPFTATWDAIRKPFASVMDDVVGSSVESLSLEAAKQAAIDAMATWVGSTFGAAAQSALFTVDVAGNFTFGGEGAWLANTLIYIYYVYLIYMVVTLLIQILFECTEDEIDLGVERTLGSCHYVGRYCGSRFLGACTKRIKGYCCFNSPFGRILQEQARPQLGADFPDPAFGTAETPICTGLTVDQLERLDWDAIDLSEWVEILTTGGVLPEGYDAMELKNTIPETTVDDFVESPDVPDGLERTTGFIQNPDDPDTAREQVRQDQWSGPGPPGD